MLVIKSLMGQELWQEAVTKAREAAGAERGNRDVHEVRLNAECLFQGRAMGRLQTPMAYC